MQAVFVYGSLKRGFYNHLHLRGARYGGPVVTVHAYALHSLGRYPGLYVIPASQRITGELYLVNDAGLERLDALEENGREYQRELIDLENADGELIRAWCYFCLLPRQSVLPGAGVHIDADGLASWQRRR